MTKVSVILPVYNVEPYLERCIESLINQTMGDLEFIFIDDCSTDNSLAILKEYAEKDDRFKIIAMEENQGAAVARNKGLDIAKGEYISFIDPDDSIDLDFYEKLYGEAQKNNSDIVKGNLKRLLADGSEKISIVQERIKNEGMYSFSTDWTSAIYKASIIFENNLRFNDEIIKAQDILFLNKILLNAESISLVDDTYYNYYIRNESLNSQKLSDKKFLSALNAIRIIFEDINNSDLINKNSDAYDTLYKYRLNSFFFIVYKNDNEKLRRLWAEYVINVWCDCKNKKALIENIRHKGIITYLKSKNAKGLLKYINKIGRLENLYNTNSFVEKIFSVKNDKRKLHKVITIFGLKIKFKKVKK